MKVRVIVHSNDYKKDLGEGTLLEWVLEDLVQIAEKVPSLTGMHYFRNILSFKPRILLDTGETVDGRGGRLSRYKVNWIGKTQADWEEACKMLEITKKEEEKRMEELEDDYSDWDDEWEGVSV